MKMLDQFLFDGHHNARMCRLSRHTVPSHTAHTCYAFNPGLKSRVFTCPLAHPSHNASGSLRSAFMVPRTNVLQRVVESQPITLCRPS